MDLYVIVDTLFFDEDIFVLLILKYFKVLDTEIFILSIKMPSSIVFISAKMVFF